jgi:hypothetical protein
VKRPGGGAVLLGAPGVEVDPTEAVSLEVWALGAAGDATAADPWASDSQGRAAHRRTGRGGARRRGRAPWRPPKSSDFGARRRRRGAEGGPP